MNLLLSLCTLALVDSVLGSNGLRANTEGNRQLLASHWSVFQNFNGGMVWPVPNSTVGNISSTFGPRVRASCNCYDFHRGVDIHGNIGDDVVASYGGVVKSQNVYSDGGNTVVLEHKFPTSYSFNGKTLTKWNSLYLHLSEWLVKVGDVVAAGDLIGRVGDSGSALTPHLHHEVRLGTRCSLEYALEYPLSTCNTYGFDPHVHPLLVYPAGMMGTSNISLSVTQLPDAQTNGILHVVTDDTVPDVNRYFVQIVSGGVTRLSHTLDLNLRIGFDASNTTTLDTPDESKPFLEPSSFGYSTSQWDIDLIIPPAWFGTLDPSEDIFVTVTNVWNEDTVISFGL